MAYAKVGCFGGVAEGSRFPAQQVQPLSGLGQE